MPKIVLRVIDPANSDKFKFLDVSVESIQMINSVIFRSSAEYPLQFLATVSLRNSPDMVVVLSSEKGRGESYDLLKDPNISGFADFRSSGGRVWVNPNAENKCTPASRANFSSASRMIIKFDDGKKTVVFGSEKEVRKSLKKPQRPTPPAPQEQAPVHRLRK